jgi:hypothetical protein
MQRVMIMPFINYPGQLACYSGKAYHFQILTPQVFQSFLGLEIKQEVGARSLCKADAAPATVN